MVLTERHFRPCPFPDNTFKIILVCCRQKSVAMYYSWNTSLHATDQLFNRFFFFLSLQYLCSSRDQECTLSVSRGPNLSPQSIDRFCPKKPEDARAQGFILERHQDLQGLILSASWVVQTHVRAPLSPHVPSLSKIIVTQGS